MAGLTEAGFVAKRTPELKLELEQLMLDAFGSVNLNPQSVFGQLVGLTVEQQADFWMRLESVYWAQYPRSAQGVNLDRMVSINGLVRLEALASVVRGVVTGSVGTALTAGRLVSATRLSTQFALLDATVLGTAASVGGRVKISSVAANTDYSITLGSTPVTYDSGAEPTEQSILAGLAALYNSNPAVTAVVTSGAGESFLDLSYDTAQEISVSSNLFLDRVSNYASFAATTPGPVNVPPGSLDRIDTPAAGWLAIENRQSGIPGRFVETDDQLRVRREKSLKLASTGTIDAIISHMQQVPGVLEQRILFNNTSATDSRGIPAHHVWAIVDGGVSEEIAAVLFAQVAAGIGYHGGVSVNHVSKVTGQSYTVKFSRPVSTPFYVSVTVAGSAATPGNIVDLIRTALVEYARTLSIGESVLWSRLFTPINAVVGDGAWISDLFVNTVTIDGPEDELTANLIADPDERFTLEAAGVQVFVV